MDRITRALVIRAIRDGFKVTNTYKLAMERHLSDVKGQRGGRRWKCAHCKILVSKSSEFNIDHINPVVEIGKKREDYSITEYYDRVHNVSLSDLQLLCTDCHHAKSAKEAALRKQATPNLVTSEPRKPRVKKKPKIAQILRRVSVVVYSDLVDLQS